MGLILPQTVTLIPSGKSINYFRNKGYDAQWHKELVVDVNDLNENSKIKVNCNCDYCNNPIRITYQKYNQVMSSNVPKIVCKNCIKFKREESNMITYGVKNTFELEETKNKIKKYFLENYGVENYAQTKECKEKFVSTCLQRYGVEHPLQNKEVRDKLENTCMQIYGTKFSSQSPKVKETYKNNMAKKYGVNYPMQLPEVKRKSAVTFAKNQTVSTSKQQIYLHSLYGGELNGVVSHYNCDIVFREDKQIIEYDGGGHFLGVKIGIDSTEDSQKKEMIRDKQIKSEGFRIMRIISRKDYLPSDSILLQMLQYARDFFTQNPQRSWISFDIDSSRVYNAYHKGSEGGIPYDFGSLRKIKKSDLQCNTLTTPSTTLSSPTLLHH